MQKEKFGGLIRSPKGITLIALVITIIVLLILAGVSLSLVAGGDGIIGKASNAVDATNVSNAQESLNLAVSELIMDYYSGNYLPDGTRFDGTIEQYINTNLATKVTGYTVTTDSKGNVTVKDSKGNTVTTGAIVDGGTISWGTVSTTELGTVTPPPAVAATYTVTFNAGSGSVSESSKTVTQGETYGTLPTPTRTGFKFVEWATEANTTDSTKYVKSSTTVNLSANQTLYAVWGLTKTEIAENPTIFYGANVNYGGSSTYQGVGWKVFNVSGEQIQLIATDYVDTSSLDTTGYDNIGVGFNAGYVSNTCGINATDNRKTLINYLKDTTKWSSFVTTGAASAKGAPSVEEFRASYNATHPANEDKSNQIEIDTKDMSDNITGYYIKWGDSEGNCYNIKGLENTTNLNYYNIDTTNAYGYWLAGGSADSTYYVMRVSYGNSLGNNVYYNDNYGVCPLVSLSSGIILVEDGSGNYNIMVND